MFPNQIGLVDSKTGRNPPAVSLDDCSRSTHTKRLSSAVTPKKESKDCAGRRLRGHGRQNLQSGRSANPGETPLLKQSQPKKPASQKKNRRPSVRN